MTSVPLLIEDEGKVGWWIKLVRGTRIIRMHIRMEC